MKAALEARLHPRLLSAEKQFSSPVVCGHLLHIIVWSQVHQVPHFLSREKVVLLSLMLFSLQPSLYHVGNSMTIVKASDIY